MTTGAGASSGFDRLRADPVLATVTRLEERIAARFPQRGLLRVAAQLRVLVSDVEQAAGEARVGRRVARWASRVLMAAVVAATVVLLVLATGEALSRRGPEETLDWLPLLESVINDLVFAGLAAWFLWSVPERLQRERLLRQLHRLRSLAHVIDMHQLTKDPERLRSDFRPSPASVEVDLDRAQMEAYLDYCSELFSLVGKTAALCAEQSQDQVVLQTVSTIETVTSSMSRNVWQKIQLLR
ncbi:hypothetical protein [Nocardioides nanhaiensis]|uniref:SMODS and SLOG-associating 2TM effector domain-containing protein n=1 Tax=Nocardioides nanhaiensis TaxID=1476871 RepID=A0ABP8WBP5_9ACTN